MPLFNYAKFKNFLYYSVLILFFIVLIWMAEYGLGRVNGIDLKRSERVRFISETAPLLISTNHLLSNLNHSFINEQRSNLSERKFRTDSFGLVKGADDEEKSMAVLFLGGSTTENNEVEEQFRFPYLAGERISTLTNIRVAGVNAGVRGHTTQDSINVYLNHPSPFIKKSKVVVMMHNINDRLRLSIDGDYKSRIDNSSRIDVAGVADSILGVVFSLRDYLVFNTNIGYLVNESIASIKPANGGPVYINETVLEKLPPLSAVQVAKFEQNYKNFIALVKANNQIPVLMTQPLGIKSNNQEQFNEAIRRVAKVENVVVIDLAKYIAEIDQYNLFFYDDGIHFNNDGSRWAADVIAGKLVEILQLKVSPGYVSDRCDDLKLRGVSFLDKPPYENVFPGRYPNFNKSEDKLLFQLNNKNGALLAYLDLRTGLVVELLKNLDPNALEHPVWFDDNSILYTKNSDLPQFRDVFYLNWKTGVNEKLTDEAGFSTAIPFVDRNGKIVFSGYKHSKYGITPPAIYFMKGLSSKPELIYSSNISESWRPIISGDKILFINNETGKYQVYQSDIGGNKENNKILFPSDAVQWDPSASSDGRFIAFSEKRNSNFDVLIFDRNQMPSKLAKRIVSSSADEWDPSISPKGQYLLYSVSTHVGDQIRAKCIK